MGNPRPKLSIVGHQSADSLSLVESLSSSYRVDLWKPDSGVVPAFRAARPGLVLLLSRSRDLKRMGELARRLKTEQRPPMVVLLAQPGLPPRPSQFQKDCLLDGLVSWPAGQETLLEILDRVRSGDEVLFGEEAGSQRIRGLARLLSGWRASSKGE